MANTIEAWNQKNTAATKLIYRILIVLNIYCSVCMLWNTTHNTDNGFDPIASQGKRKDVIEYL